MKTELVVVTPPALELPLTVVKQYCRISNTNDDTVILPMLIQSARERVEQYLGRALFTQTLSTYFEVIEKEFFLPRAPIQSVDAVNLIYLNNNTLLTAASDYYVMGSQDQYIILTATTYNLPRGFSPADDLSRFNLQVTYHAGYDSAWPWTSGGTPQASKIPMGICQAMLMMIYAAYEIRSDLLEASRQGTINIIEIPEGSRKLLDRYKIPQL
jgi:uncharacterized phiE125 gp8 family phage protein